jgi:hypothetical protein
VTGRVQSANGVVHVIAESLWTPVLGAPPPEARSRDWG